MCSRLARKGPSGVAGLVGGLRGTKRGLRGKGERERSSVSPTRVRIPEMSIGPALVLGVSVNTSLQPPATSMGVDQAKRKRVAIGITALLNLWGDNAVHWRSITFCASTYQGACPSQSDLSMLSQTRPNGGRWADMSKEKGFVQVNVPKYH